ncbi:MAG TPA: ATP-binding protein [Spirillospora sp.]
MRRARERLPPSRWSARTRVTVTATLLVLLLLAAEAMILFQVVRFTVFDGLHDGGTRAIAHLSETVRTTDPRGRLHVTDTEFTLLQVQDDQGRVLASSGALEGRGPVDVPAPARPDHPVHRSADFAGEGEVYWVTERVHSPGGWRIVHAGTTIREFKLQSAFIVMLGVAVLVGTAVVGYIVSLAVRRALRPVRTMSAELAEITGRAPDRRVSVPAAEDDVSELAQSVNVTLGRLEDALERQRAFAADVSHELRSPLTGLQTRLELALEHPEDEDWPQVARAALADADRLQGIVADLLVLAKVGAGVEESRERVDFASLIRAEVARRGLRVPVEVSVPEEMVAHATPRHMARVLRNLLDNAERHAESRIWVSAAVEEGHVVVEVLDDGAGIAPEDRERIFRRFARLAESRERDTGGSGLGLTISRDIAQAHGGTLIVADSDRGARFVLRFPVGS